MKPEVVAAIEEVRAAFPGHSVEVEAEPQGGAYVIVHELPMGGQYCPITSWVGFLITFQYPFADVYPHFVVPDLRRADGNGHGGGFSPGNWRGRPVLQISRRSNALNTSVDTAATKLAKVLAWIQSQ